jgi:hypothetical protein
MIKSVGAENKKYLELDLTYVTYTIKWTYIGGELEF